LVRQRQPAGAYALLGVGVQFPQALELGFGCGVPDGERRQFGELGLDGVGG
jgi:hypothetical protein